MKKIIFTVLAFYSMNALSVSINCKKATTVVDFLICDDAKLSELDKLMNKKYVSALRDSSNDGDIKKEQVSWLKNERDKCQDLDCLVQAYNKRIDELSTTVSSNTASIASSFTVKPKDSLQDVRTKLNTDLDLEPLDNGYGLDKNRLWIRSKGITVFFDSNNTVRHITLISPFSGTVSGIKIGDGINKVLSILGQPLKKEQYDTRTYSYVTSDNYFTKYLLGSDDKVETIELTPD